VNSDALKDDLLALARKDFCERLARLQGGYFNHAAASVFAQRVITRFAQCNHSGIVLDV
jgi:hypothetical protein